MRHRDVGFAPEAVDDLVRLYEWIANAAGPDTAMAYVARLEAYCLGFDLASERGTLRGDADRASELLASSAG